MVSRECRESRIENREWGQCKEAKIQVGNAKRPKLDTINRRPYLPKSISKDADSSRPIFFPTVLPNQFYSPSIFPHNFTFRININWFRIKRRSHLHPGQPIHKSVDTGELWLDHYFPFDIDKTPGHFFILNWNKT